MAVSGTFLELELITHPTLRSKTTRKSAAIRGNATSGLFELSRATMTAQLRKSYSLYVTWEDESSE